MSPALNAVAQRILMPEFVLGRNNVVADALSRPNQVLGSEWMLHQDVFSWLRQRWPVTINLFASSLGHRCSVYFASVSDPMAAGTDAMLQSWDLLQVYMVGVEVSASLLLSSILPVCVSHPGLLTGCHALASTDARHTAVDCLLLASSAATL